VETNGVLECKVLPKTRTVPLSRLGCGARVVEANLAEHTDQPGVVQQPSVLRDVTSEVAESMVRMAG
jgi:hypothetical protein